MMTLRQQVEAEMGFPIPPVKNTGPPRAWRKSIKYWFALAVGYVLGCITVGVLSVLISIGTRV